MKQKILYLNFSKILNFSLCLYSASPAHFWYLTKQANGCCCWDWMQDSRQQINNVQHKNYKLQAEYSAKVNKRFGELTLYPVSKCGKKKYQQSLAVAKPFGRFSCNKIVCVHYSFLTFIIVHFRWFHGSKSIIFCWSAQQSWLVINLTRFLQQFLTSKLAKN